MLLYVLQAAILGLSMVFIAAPLRARQIAQIQAAGPGRGALAMLHPLVSDIPRALAVLLLLAQLPSWFLEASRFVGGVLLIYLAWRAMRALYVARDEHGDRAIKSGPMDAPRSLALWLLDPVLYLLWATVLGPLLLASWRHAPTWGLVFLGGWYGAVTAGVLVVFLLIFAFGKLGSAALRAISFMCAMMIVLLSFLQLWTGSQALIARFF